MSLMGEREEVVTGAWMKEKDEQAGLGCDGLGHSGLCIPG